MFIVSVVCIKNNVFFGRLTCHLTSYQLPPRGCGFFICCWAYKLYWSFIHVLLRLVATLLYFMQTRAEEWRHWCIVFRPEPRSGDTGVLYADPSRGAATLVYYMQTRSEGWRHWCIICRPEPRGGDTGVLYADPSLATRHSRTSLFLYVSIFPCSFFLPSSVS